MGASALSGSRLLTRIGANCSELLIREGVERATCTPPKPLKSSLHGLNCEHNCEHNRKQRTPAMLVFGVVRRGFIDGWDQPDRVIGRHVELKPSDLDYGGESGSLSRRHQLLQHVQKES